MPIRSHHLLTLGCVVVLAACAGERPGTETFIWKGPITADTWLRLRNVSGDFEIRQGTSDTAEIKLVIERTSSYAPRAQVRVLQTANGTLACVLYGEDNECTTAEYRGGNTEKRSLLAFMRGRTTVQGSIILPRGVSLDAESTDGDIDAAVTGTGLIVKTVNGDVAVRGTPASVTVNTTNGDVGMAIEQIGTAITVETTNGDVTLEVPATIGAALNMRTTNGELSLGMPGTVTTSTPKQIMATIGAGGSPIDIATVNGGIRLRPR